jgi:3-deoxy-D-manno-octulosonic acid kinase
VVAHASVAAAVRSAMSGATLHEWAARQPGARGMQGRATAWATTMPGGVEVVVRHSRHGGLLAPLTGDLFLAPTRAPGELATAIRLAAAGVPTPEVLGYAIYPAIGPFVRADVATRLLRGVALPEAWKATESDDDRWALIELITSLLTSLRRVGARHPDLNVRNVFIVDGAGAAVLDVDRVEFGAAGDASIAGRNVQRLLRSMAKARVGVGADLSSRQVERLNETAGAVA